MPVYTQDDDKTFDEMWTVAQVNFEKTTKKGLKRTKNYTLDDVTQFLEQKYNPVDSDEQSDKKARILGVVSNVASFLQLLGGIAAQGASMVFPGSGMCFNALQFLINIPGKISKVYEDIAVLFEKIDTFLRTFQIYKRVQQFMEMDREFKHGVNKILIKFVEICAVSIKILDGGKIGRFITGAKVALFNDDSGVGVLLLDFERLIQQHSQISDAVTLEHVLKSENHLSGALKEVHDMLYKTSEDNARKLAEIEKGTEFIVSDIVTRTSKEKDEHMLKTISEKLAIKQATALEPEKNFEQLRQDSIPGTGNWLKDVVEYQDWSECRSGSNSLLLLKGDNGAGKSNVVSAVGNMLKSKNQAVDGKSKRIAVAYYAFRRSDKSSRDGTSSTVSRSITALKSMAVQVARQERNYVKDLSAHLENKDPSFSRDMQPEQLCRELFLPPNSKEHTDVVYFLLLDDLDQIPEAEVILLFKAILQMASTKLRVMVSATEKLLNSVVRSFEQPIDLSSIKCADYNKPDIVAYMESLINKNIRLQESSPPISRILAHIRETLPNIVEGSFSNVSQIFDAVNEACEDNQSDEETIKSKVTMEVVKEESKRVAIAVAELNETLSERDIVTLNELLAWVLYAPKWMNVDDLRAVQFLRNKQEPIWPLEEQLRGKYAKMFSLEDQNPIYVMPGSDALDAFFSAAKREKRQDDVEKDNDARISMTIKLHKLKRTEIQRFFWDLNEKILLDRFPFENEAKSKTSVEACKSTSLLKIWNQSIKLLWEEPRDETKILLRCAADLLPFQLANLRECVDELDKAEKTEIVKQTVELLRDPTEILEKRWTEKFYSSDWRSDFYLDAIWEWLKDPEATMELSPRDRMWIDTVTSGAKVGSIKNVTLIMARQLLRSREKDPGTLFFWIDDVIDQEQQHIEEKKKELETAGEKSSKPNSEIIAEDNAKTEQTWEQRIERVLTWAEKELGIKDKDSIFYERIGALYLDFASSNLITDFRSAEKAFQKAAEFANASWAVFEGLADIYSSKYSEARDLNAALTAADKAVKILARNETMTEEDKKSLSRILTNSAGWDAELNNLDEAISKLRRAVEVAPTQYNSHVELMKFLARQEKSAEAVEFLSEMKKRTVNDKDVNHLEDMINYFAEQDDFEDSFNVVFGVTKGDDLFSAVCETIEDQLKEARKKKETVKVARLTLSQGLAFAIEKQDKDRLETAARMWKDCCRVCFETEEWETWQPALLAGELAIKHHFTIALSIEVKDDIDIHISEVKKLVEGAASHPYITVGERLRAAFGGFYSLLQQQDQSRKVLLRDLVSSLDLLSDDDPENDYYGHYNLADVFLHVGDDLNSLSAWSLLGPIDHETQENHDPNAGDSTSLETTDKVESTNVRTKKQKGKLGNTCDGKCGTEWTYADNFWCCKLCSSVQFCPPCFEKVKNGTMGRSICSADHQWLHVPPWSDEERARVGSGNVLIGGELVDGKRVGGDIVPVNDWLDLIRAEWGIEIPKKDAAPVDDGAKAAE